ncbi:hypothetical protein DWV29_09705 [Enterocloster asparagiformis]|uniref:Uncharacterized protein n=2 Tax=Enterocloster asparagiformis TaxID=333367 RepID=C0CZ72_9FIRM|nr:hypothetical protein CLOSTASPAR_02299 [[Clostridium] asparagiforme DSM 15981]RGX29968.1 hypothetical protein DWV29_09705 [Enterocloster asparagiformis]
MSICFILRYFNNTCFETSLQLKSACGVMKILHDRYGKIALLVFSNICYNFIVTIYFFIHFAGPV